MTTQQEIEELVGQLWDYRTRSDARHRLRQIGEEAAPRLLELLDRDDAPPNARWAAVTVLGDCKCEQATERLLDVMRNDHTLRGDAGRALQSITGKDVGEDVEEWERALGLREDTDENEKPDTRRMEPPDGTDEMELLRAALGDEASQIRWEEPGYAHIRMPVGEERKQQMIVTFDEKDRERQPLVCVYTECGPDTEDAQAAIFRRNVTLQFGRFSIEKDEGDNGKVVMRHYEVRSHLQPDHLRDIIVTMAREADNLEYELTQSDRI